GGGSTCVSYATRSRERSQALYFPLSFAPRLSSSYCRCMQETRSRRMLVCVLSSGEQTMGAKIIDRGRGPEIEGTRITVYDVMDYLQEGWRYDQMAGLFRLPPDDIQAAIQYIESHHAEVMADYQQILARQSQVQYSPEVQAKLARSHQKLQAKLAEIRSRHQP